MTRITLQQRRRSRVPTDDRVVGFIRTKDKIFIVREHCRLFDRLLNRTCETMDHLARPQIPEFAGRIPSAREDIFAILGDRRRCYALARVSILNRPNHLARDRIPHLDGTILRG